MNVITYCVTLLEPTLVTSLQGDPNSAVAFDYLPGSALRGMVISRYLGSKSTDASDSTLRRLFFDGTTRYLNGYPLDVYDRPGVPAPASWHQAKHGEEGTIFDFAVEGPEDKKKQWQVVAAPFYTRSGKGVRLIRPARNMMVHTQRTARFGRAMPRHRPAEGGQASEGSTKLLEEDEIAGAVYRYDALAAGQSFQAAIICDHDADASTLLPFIEGHVILGGSRSGGYGRAKICHVSIHATDSDGDAMEDGEDLPENRLIVTLQSDVLVRDGHGQFAVDPELLCQVLGKHLQTQLVLEDAFLGTQVVGGFNRKWRLPLPQALAVRMGSVLIFHDPGCKRELLDALEARGIGERRAEGFGRLVFNRQRAAELTIEESTRPNRDLSVFLISETEDSKLAELMVNRILRRRLDESLLAAANAAKIFNPPSNAQLSRLRGIVLEELRNAPPNTSKICQYIKSIEERSSARRQFERSTINKVPLLRWLKNLLQYESKGAWKMEDNAWQDLLKLDKHKDGTRIDTLAIGGVRAKINDGLRLEYVLRLIDLVLAHAAKQRGKEG